MSLSFNALSVGDNVFFNMKGNSRIKNMRGRILKELREYPATILDIDMDNRRVLISGMHFHNGKKWISEDSYGKVTHIRRTRIKK